MAQVKAVSGATAEEFKALEANALDLGSSTKFTASEVSGLQLEFSKLGFSAAEITKVTQSTLALAQATGSDLATSAEVAGATLRGFGLDAAETQRVTDVMAASFSSTALDMSSFQDSMKFVAPVAKAAGISIEQTTAMLGALANNGIKGSQAGTALRRIISELGATGGDVAGALKNLAGEGLNLADAKDEVGRSAQSALLVLTENIDVTDELTNSFNNAEGAAGDMAAIMDDTSAGALARMRSALEGAGIEIGKALAPLIIELAGFVSHLANKFKNLDDGTKKIILVIGGLAGALGPILVAVPSLIAGFGKLRMAFVAMSGPIGIVVGALAGSAIAIKEIIDFSDSFKTSGERMADTMRGINESSKKQTIQAEALVEMYGKETTSLEDRKRILEELKGIDEKHFGNLKEENTTLVDLNKSLESYVANTKQLAMEKALAAESTELYAELAKAEIDLFDAKQAIAVHEQKLVDKGIERDSMRFNLAMNAQPHLIGALQHYEKNLAKQTKKVEEFEQRKIDIVSKFTVTADTAAEATDNLAESTSALSVSSGEVSEEVEQVNTALSGLNIETIQASSILNETEKDFKKLELRTTDLSSAFQDTRTDFEKMQDSLSEGGLLLQDTFMKMGNSIGFAFAQMIKGSKDAGKSLKEAVLGVIDAALASSTALIIEAMVKAGSFSGPAAPFVIPALVTAGIGLVRGLFAAITVPAMAEGGIVSGNTVVQVGEYPGASTNPEVIAPLDKLRSMIGGGMGGGVQVHGVIRGRDIFLTNERASREVGNLRGAV